MIHDITVRMSPRLAKMATHNSERSPSLMATSSKNRFQEQRAAQHLHGRRSCPRFPSAAIIFLTYEQMPVPINESMASMAYQQSDVHSYCEFNYQGTNWTHALYELPFSGGFPDNFGSSSQMTVKRAKSASSSRSSRPPDFLK